LPTDETGADDVAADRVYAAPASAHDEAARLLADPAATPDQKADSLWTLGRSAYYANQVSDAVVYLREALPLVDEPGTRADLVLTLAPALSKEGHVAEALQLLEPDQDGLSVRQQALLHNQRGILFTEHGRLLEAKSAFLISLELLEEIDDSALEARVLVNIGASVSQMGDQDEAEDWYRRGWELTTATGQDVVAAGIEGNLGYVASRRGDFARALGWYDRARKTFATLGNVDLLIAVLETDYATTLLDVGLDADAAEAARYAVESSRSGGNRVHEVQARVILGEALVRLDRHREAQTNLQSARDSAIELGIPTWAMRADYLRLRLTALAGDELPADFGREVGELADSLRGAGWEREALRATHVGAQALVDVGAPTAASELLERARTSVDAGRADPIDVALSRALAARIDRDSDAQQHAIQSGLDEVDRQRRMLGSAEMQVRLGHRARAFRDLAITTAIADGDAVAVLVASETSRNRLTMRPGLSDGPGVQELLSQLRDTRVSRSEAQLAGSTTEDLDQRIRALEGNITQLARRGSSNATSDESSAPDLLNSLRNDEATAFVSYVRAGDALWALRSTGTGLDLIELDGIAPIQSAARMQSVALRRMATAGEAPPGTDSRRLDAINEELDRLLVAPLELESGTSIVIVPARLVSGLAWAGLPSLADSAITVAPSAGVWAAGPATLEVRSLGLLGGPALRQADAELDELVALWGSELTTMHKRATASQATSTLGSSDAVHVAAHGSFRSDNPYFSSIEFVDGPLTLLDLERLGSMPELVMVASCDGAAGAGGEGNEVVGTTATMIGLGVSVVIAPTVAVDDAAARRFSIDVHRSLVDEVPVSQAVRDARQRAMARGTPGDRSVAMSFQVHGNRAASQALRITPT